ncbi:polysaccharide deacetylase family protein [Spongiactinospora rosea]|nr:polysaccharide deacetylase family protein [Spongiactinospora rosea]
MRSPAFVTRAVAIANVIVVAAALLSLQSMSGQDPPVSHPVTKPRPKTGPTAAPATTPAVPPQVQALPSVGPPEPVTATPESARRVKANELGLVPVIMYHRIIAKRYASIDRTPAAIRAELVRLAKEGYVPVTAREFVRGEINIPAGAHPVVLTFDDGHESHFALDERGMPAKDTAVAIIYDVAKKYPDFRPVATFWINSRPFGLKDRKRQEQAVRWLVERGFEVGNHTWSHPDLRAIPPKRAREQIARGERQLHQLGVTDSETFALPFGSRPRGKTSKTGKWNGTRYDYKGVFLAGAEPSLSPHHKKLDRGAIQRIQSNGKRGECRRWCSRYWLDWLAKHPDQRYTADGDPARISIPRKLQGNIAVKGSQQVNAY